MATQTSSAQPTQLKDDIDVDVRAYIDTITKKVEFDHEWDAPGKPKKKGKIEVDYGAYMVPITFHLRDETGLGLEFYSTAQDAMYVGIGPDCPTGQGNAGQIQFNSAPKKDKLEVVDANTGDACDLKYTLRFSGNPNAAGKESAPYEYDPELRNGGGGV
jgi:hypothetical protein